MPVDKEIRLSNHAMDQIIDRGTSAEEVKSAIRDGEEIPAKKVEKVIGRIFPLNLIGSKILFN
jgi:hypothetical protein